MIPEIQFQCPLCKATANNLCLCMCGYDLVQRKVMDWQRAHLWWSEPSSNWFQPHERLAHLQELSGLSPRQLADKFGASSSHITIWRKVQLARAFENDPSLRECRNESHARKYIDRRERIEQFTEFEEELQRYLENNWEKTPWGHEWNLCRRGKFRADPVGIIDLLAKHRREPKYLVVELKRDETPDQTVGQVLRYMGWVQRDLLTTEESVEGLIIGNSQAQSDSNLIYALVPLPSVSLFQYERNNASEFNFRPVPVARNSQEYVLHRATGMTNSELNDLISSLQNMS